MLRKKLFDRMVQNRTALALVLFMSPVSGVFGQETGESESRWDLGITAVTEGQWNPTHKAAAWQNRLDVEAGVGLWKDARLSARLLSTYGTDKEVGDGLNGDFSNINAPNRPLRLTHLGIEQRWLDSRLGLAFGVRQADEDYWVSPVTSIFTCGSYGCVPVAGNNRELNVHPVSAVGLHADYAFAGGWKVQASLYNGRAYDTVDKVFRVRPHRDGIVSLGALSYSQESGDNEYGGSFYQLSWIAGSRSLSDGRRLPAQCSFWGTVEHSLFRTGRVTLAGMLTAGVACGKENDAKNYWTAAIAADGLTRKGGTLAVSFEQAKYADGLETDVETTFVMPLGKYLSLQPALHYFHLNGHDQFVGQLRLTLDLSFPHRD